MERQRGNKGEQDLEAREALEEVEQRVLVGLRADDGDKGEP